MPPATLGPYTLLDRIGAGGMGEVYRARDSRLDRTVALKLLPERSSSDREQLQRFEREARAASSLNHPHIISIFDAGEIDGTAYISMELVDGLPLTEWAARQRPSLARTPDVFTQVAPEPRTTLTRMTPLTTDAAFEGDPTFSPDGKLIAYVSDRTGNFDIFLKRIDGGPDLQLTIDPGDDVQPAFSPDGSELVYAARQRIWKVERGRASVPLTSGGSGGDTQPRLSSDGQLIAFAPGSSAARHVRRITLGHESRWRCARCLRTAQCDRKLLYARRERTADPWLMELKTDAGK